MAAFYAAGLNDYISLDAIIRNNERLREALEDNLAATVAAYLGIYALAVAVSFPGASLITIVGGFLFGAVLGTALTVVAATAGATVIFLAAKSSLGGVLRERAGRFAQRFTEGFNENAFNYLLFLRLVPLFPFWLVNVAPAIFDVPLRVYVIATAVGIIPGTFAYTLVGDSLGGLIAAQERANPGCADAGTCQIELGALLTPGVIAAIVALSVAALIPVALKRWRKAKGAAR
ncbi:TVP38/TMEM64 family protein [Acuticoccus sediminis]|uniref:TVP38/TMEM64 family membrane protein n=1 Tax=Acuticoccus sediminis TaxID=2184697 RepID=A0A8B2NUU6_9HYPH|nr:TVP38/TMEM64 family protein [Acuticoccus sediminis]RAH99406.1 TVP38/TMEM64 family protein [Acuticoccus sediminis]